MKTFVRLLPAALIIAFASCITNDLPYPWVLPSFSQFEIASEDAGGHPLIDGRVEIDSVNREITIPLSVWANISEVPLVEWSLNDGSQMISPAEGLPDILDLTNPINVTLQLYDREFQWTIKATQNIERYFNIASQVGTSVIDVENHTVTSLVPMEQPLTEISVRRIMLSGPLSVMEPDLSGMTVDFTSPITIKVTEFGKTVDWTVSVKQTDVSVELEKVDAWTQVAWLYANAEDGRTNGFEYRLETDDEWTVVPTEWITYNGGSYSACLRNLEPMTTYVARATSDDEHSVEKTFTTSAIIQLPNSDFTQWSLSGEKLWNPWANGGTEFWGTGNKGATTFGDSNTTPIADPSSPTGYQGASLLTVFIGPSAFGKLAAGNLFAGSYVRTDGTNGVLSMGREFTVRPTAVKATVQYTTAPISDASKSNPDLRYMIGQPDTCIVWCALIDSDEPFEIRTKSSDRHLFDPAGPEVVAYGEFTSGQDTDGMIEVTIPLKYVSTSRVPKYILLTASASKYGDFFTGGRGAIMLVKRYELIYDYISR